MSSRRSIPFGLDPEEDRRAPADDPDRGAQYEAACLAWESLTDEEIWGDPRPSLPPIRELETS